MPDSILFDVNSPTTATGNYYASSQKDDLRFYNGASTYHQQSSYEPSSYYTPPQASGDMTGYMEPPTSFWNAFGTAGLPGEPSLMEELDVNLSHIKDKSLTVLIPFRSIPPSIMDDTDLAGPLLYLFLYGLGLMLSGKVHFGYIYGVGMLGVGSLYVLLNLMSQEQGVDWALTASVLGYCLLPMVMLSGVTIVFQTGGNTGWALAVLSFFWCTLSSAAMFTSVLHMQDQRLLVTYPVGLFYACFALMTIF
ncbi:uncharacterized protein BX664DRAFT_361796 [Halteromyces radiatus]|uniref:uncharacterized protein n=1 Tax=Halteromyces radiatus TaxID=101107 RepID=UPI00221E4D72|nr:uncharacterized protein BX664DRAFT_361796 [Halteromyces radiatus]KAI8081666.1 hypothetical protein BX664DRAFT_361796 [Halteromyces radiatus]